MPAELPGVAKHVFQDPWLQNVREAADQVLDTHQFSSWTEEWVYLTTPGCWQVTLKDLK